jgi:hypothetical protein
MTPLAAWQQQNDRYLAMALTWLRLRLVWQIKQDAGDAADLEPPLAALDPDQLTQAEAAMQSAAETQPPPALVRLSQQLGLSPFEQTLLLLCAAQEWDLTIADLCRQLRPRQPYPTFALALQLFAEAHWDALAPDRPLRYWQLLEIQQAAGQPLSTSALQADERIVYYLKGYNRLDDRLVPLLLPLAHPVQALPPSQQAIVERLDRSLQQADPTQPLPLVQLVGTDAASQQWVAQQVAQRLGLRLYRLPVALLPTQTRELDPLARLWQRESRLLPLALYLDAHELETAAIAGPGVPLVRFLAASDDLFFLGSREGLRSLGRPSLTQTVAKPTPVEQQQVWERAIGDWAPQSPDRLAAQFDLNGPEIEEIAQRCWEEWEVGEGERGFDVNSAERSGGDGECFHDRLWQECLSHTRPRLEGLAQPLDPRATWADIVLPAPELALLHQLADQVAGRSLVYDQWGFRQRMNRGLGISALFAGDSGTGKTMAAEVLANALQLNLYRIDLSAVVSKYIGETEKNLRRLFDAAEAGGAVLFFDEADALFGKRSEVRDSHDRYANIEINYLLQRMEAYRGLAILATNRKGALDTAFLRRLRFIINFPFPGMPERRAIWERVFPPETPRTELDLEWLARLTLTGGSIHNIALNAAFLAAKAGEPVTMAQVLAAARMELQKLDRPINELEFQSVTG